MTLQVPHERLVRTLGRLTALRKADVELLSALPIALRRVSAGQDLAENATTHCTLVLNGFLCGYSVTDRSDRQILSFFLAGDCPDLDSLFLPSSEHQQLAALGPALVGFIPQTALHEAIADSPRLALALWRETLVTSSKYREWVAIGRRNALTRVAHLLCEVVFRLHCSGLARDLRTSIPWTQGDIAAACGLSAVHANRVIQHLRQRRFLDIGSREVRVRDWEGLTRVAGFSPDYLHALPSAGKEVRTQTWGPAP